MNLSRYSRAFEGIAKIGLQSLMNIQTKFMEAWSEFYSDKIYPFAFAPGLGNMRLLGFVQIHDLLRFVSQPSAISQSGVHIIPHVFFNQENHQINTDRFWTSHTSERFEWRSGEEDWRNYRVYGYWGTECLLPKEATFTILSTRNFLPPTTFFLSSENRHLTFKDLVVACLAWGRLSVCLRWVGESLGRYNWW